MNHPTEIRFPLDTWEKLRTLSFTSKESINSIVNKAVVQYLKEIGK